MCCLASLRDQPQRSYSGVAPHTRIIPLRFHRPSLTALPNGPPAKKGHPHLQRDVSSPKNPEKAVHDNSSFRHTFPCSLASAIATAFSTLLRHIHFSLPPSLSLALSLSLSLLASCSIRRRLYHDYNETQRYTNATLYHQNCNPSLVDPNSSLSLLLPFFSSSPFSS